MSTWLLTLLGMPHEWRIASPLLLGRSAGFRSLANRYPSTAPVVREVIQGPYQVISEVSDEDVRVLAMIHGGRWSETCVSLFPEGDPWSGGGLWI